MESIQSRPATNLTERVDDKASSAHDERVAVGHRHADGVPQAANDSSSAAKPSNSQNESRSLT